MTTVLPSGTVTFLFTDLEGSTRLWEQDPDGMRPALVRHDALLRAAVEGQGGHVVKTMGDGFHAVFASAHDAVAAAVAGQEALGAEVWSAPGPLRVRMGLHTGDATPRDGDYYGPAANRAARVMTAAHGGQVLLSGATSEIVRDEPVDDLVVVDLGEHQLRDLARPEHVWQVAAPTMQQEFPPLRVERAAVGNLPGLLASFVGRVPEREAVARALTSARLVTITGVAGVGKSRLALQVAHDVAAAMRDGAWLVGLSATNEDDDVVVQAVCDALRLPPPSTGTNLLDHVVDELHADERLLVLDDCEHVLGGVARFVEVLLQACPSVQVLATSREALGVPGEQVWPLGSLSLPPTTAIQGARRYGIPSPEERADDILGFDAVRLFAERAAAVQPDFVVDDTNASAVAEICRRLDGIPLALELAAARVAVMSPADLVDRLDQRFQILTGGRRTASERHQTLRAAIEWSYETLSARERIVFERLGVFHGRFDAAAAAAVAADDDLQPWDALDGLSELVAKSMVVTEDTRHATRYHLLETLQAFARERLEAAGDAPRRFARHALHYTRLAEEIGTGLFGSDEVQWRRRLHRDIDNIRAVLARSFMDDYPSGQDDAERVVAALAIEALHDRSVGIGVWAEYLAGRPGEVPVSARRAAVLGAAALHAQGRGDLDRMRARAEQAFVDGSRPAGPGAVLAYAALAAVDGLGGDVDGALATIARGDDALRGAGVSPTELSHLHSTAANLLVIAGRLEDAGREALIALELARETKNPSATASALFGLAQAKSRDDPDTALRSLDECVALARGGAGGGLFGFVLALSARLRIATGDRARGLRDLREAVVHAQGGADRLMIGVVVECAIEILGAVGDERSAAALAASLEQSVSMHAVSRTGGADLARALATARAEVVDGSADAVSTSGARMSRDELLALALAAVDELIAAPASA